MLNKPVQELEEKDLVQAVADQVPEGKTVDYKEALPGNDTKDRVHFLADVTALANAAGGLLLFGVKERREGREKTGLPESIPGLEANHDETIRRLDNMLSQSVKPRIQGVVMHRIPLSNGNWVLAIRVPRSWNGPHVVDYQNHWKFYTRSEAGNKQMDVDEVRTAMTLTDTVTQRLHRFRLERLGRIVAGETPLMMPPGAKTVLHILPLGLDDPRTRLDISELARDHNLYGMLLPLHTNADYRINLDGVLVYSHRNELGSGYVQLFRSGAIEVVDHPLLSNSLQAQAPYIPPVPLERGLLQRVPEYFKALQRVGVSPPVAVGLTLLGVRGYTLGASAGLRKHLVDRDDLVLPEVLVDDLTESAQVFMRPLFDMVWQACGYRRCENYNEQGHWRA